MNKYIVFGLILLVVLAVGFSVFKKEDGEQSQSVQSATETTVHYTNAGFSPNPLNVKIGATVTFINESSLKMWVASAFHPTHQELPGFDQLKWVGNGGTYQYTFTKVGDWKYHNHLNPSHFGTVVVK